MWGILSAKDNHSCSSGWFSKVFWYSSILFKRILGCSGHESGIILTVLHSSSTWSWRQQGVLPLPLPYDVPCDVLIQSSLGDLWFFSFHLHFAHKMCKSFQFTKSFGFNAVSWFLLCVVFVVVVFPQHNLEFF